MTKADALVAELFALLKSPPDDENRASRAEALLKDLSAQGSDLDHHALLTVAAYTDSEDAWTTWECARAAENILTQALQGEENKQSFITRTLLNEHLRPIFSHSTSKVTSSGRPVYFPEAKEGSRRIQDEPAWRSEGEQAIPVFQWAVKASDGNSIRESWHMYTPVLLTLIEDQKTSIRVRGLRALKVFIEKCPPRVLSTTGIGAVLQDAVFPTLLFLPSLTPEIESMALLDPAYQALLALAKSDVDIQGKARRQLLDKVLRDGVFAGLHHASEHIRIVTILLTIATDIVNALSIYAAKHLEHILLAVSGIMTDPFASAYSPAVIAAVKLLNTCIFQCWPRMLERDRINEALRMIILCWLNVHSDEPGSQLSATAVSEISAELKIAARCLQVNQASGTTGPSADLSKIITREPRLELLFHP